MYILTLLLTFSLALTAVASPVCNAAPSPVKASTPDTNTPKTSNSTMSPSTGKGTGRKLQATVTGYGVCLTQGMACGLTASPGKDPTAAMSGYLIPDYASGTCGTCWRVSNPRGLEYHGKDAPPTVGGSLKSQGGNGMVVLINNSCSPGKDQLEPGAVGQCAQTDANPKDKLGSQTVLDLCSETDAVQMFFGSPKPGLAVADIEEVDCGEWSGTVRKVK